MIEDLKAIGPELCRHFNITTTVLYSSLKKLGYSFKKKTLRYVEASSREQALFLKRLHKIPSEKVYYLDESGFNPGSAHGYGWSPVGERCYGEKIGSVHQDTFSVISAYQNSKLIEPMIYKGTLNRTMFALYLDQVLLPKLPSESVLVMDNLPCHKGKEIEAVAAKRSISIMYLPAYSPELNPSEKCWSHTKKEVYRIFDSLVDNFFEVLKEVLNIFTLSEDSVPTF